MSLAFITDVNTYSWIIIWALVIIITVVVELQTVNLVTIWFAVGAVGAMIAALLNAPLHLQIIIFLVSSLVLLISTRPFTKKLMNRAIVKTNADKVIGTVVIVTKAILPGDIGEVKAESTIWRAVNYDGKTFEVGEKVIVDAISGTKLIVSKLNDDDSIVHV